VYSGGSWDLVRVQLVPGQKSEDFNQAARALASARGVARCPVRELSPNVVSIDFQRRNLLADLMEPLLCQTAPKSDRARNGRITRSLCTHRHYPLSTRTTRMPVAGHPAWCGSWCEMKTNHASERRWCDLLRTIVAGSRPSYRRRSSS